MPGNKNISNNCKFVFVTGGVVSGLGKGIVAASLGRLLKERGIKVSIQKLDPYLNVDPGTMSPYQHGEVFVTDDGAETDLDLGHYERFIDNSLKRFNSVTSGRIYSDVISKERKGEYLGGTVQMVPHVTDEIKSKIHQAAKEAEAEVFIVEVGGTVGDIESSIFLEAIRQMKIDQGKNNTAYIHVTLIPKLKATDELKTKPTQHSMESLRSKGIHADILVLRADDELEQGMKEKLSLFTDIPVENIIQSKDCKSIYKVPLVLAEEGLAARVLETLGLETKTPDLSRWQTAVDKLINPSKGSIKLAIVGKYASLNDAYLSVIESLKHACAEKDFEADIRLIPSDEIKNLQDAAEKLQGIDAICVPGGFGDRGIEGKLFTIRWARENKIPCLGLCLGLQCTVIEFARNVMSLDKANSIEFDPETPDPVIHLMDTQADVTEKGGTMRLGLYDCKLQNATKAAEVYKAELIQERHRHRYEFNNSYREAFEKSGLVISGTSPDNSLVEIVEVKDHPYLVACQFHPEFISRPDRPHALFSGLIKAAIAQASKTLETA